jgi:glutamine synthetase
MAESDDRAAVPSLVTLIGKPPSEWTVLDLQAVVRELGIRLLSLMHVGGDGLLKALDFVPRSDAHLRDILAGGERADGSSLFPGLGVQVASSDVILAPRPATAFLDPFAPQPTLAVLCGHLGPDLEPLAPSPDTIVRRAFERVRRETGIELHALGEVEFFLGKRAAEGDGNGVEERGYHATAPAVFGEALRREAIVLLADMRVPVKYAHAEVGYIARGEADERRWEQHEIELALQPLPEAAEAVVLTHWVLGNLARRQGLAISFDPVVRVGHAGSGLHFHLSPLADGRHLATTGDDGKLQAEAGWLVGGLVQIGAALMAFGNRAPASLLRLNQGRETPLAVVWGERNRSALVRLPVLPRGSRGEPSTAPTVEFRLPDASAHPHLLLAGIAQAMLLGRATPGLTALLDRTRASRAAASPEGAAPVPRTFAEVARELDRWRPALAEGGVFPAALLDQVAERLAQATAGEGDG